MNRNNALKKLVLAALFVALDLLFTRVLRLPYGWRRTRKSANSGQCRVRLGAGPLVGAGVAAAADLLGSAVGTSGYRSSRALPLRRRCGGLPTACCCTASP